LVFTKFTYFSPCFFNLWQNYGKTFLQFIGYSGAAYCIRPFYLLGLKIKLFHEYKS
jgi:hypothetical protein